MATVSSSEGKVWNDVKQIGRLTFSRSDRIGKGCNGTNVFRGKFKESEGQPEIDVAIKRVLFERTKEIEKVFMEKTDQPHPNVLQHYCTEEDDDFIYIATELCAGTLDDIIKGSYKGPSAGSPREMMLQISLGLHHLHKNNIVHRDIKPTNILVSFPDPENNGVPRMKLADFGLCRIVKTDGSQSSLTKCGTKGWMAPELQSRAPSIKEEHAMLAVDIFSLGCVFAYSLSKGNQHPFGTESLRDHRMQNNEDMILSVGDFEPYGQTLFDLIQSMLTHNSMDRISIQDLVSHSFFI